MNYANLTKQELLEMVTDQQTLKDAVDTKDKEIGRLNKRIVELQETISTMITKENYDAYRKDLEEQRNKAADIANRYIQAHRDLMKMFKINLDVAISHEELLAERLK